MHSLIHLVPYSLTQSSFSSFIHVIDTCHYFLLSPSPTLSEYRIFPINSLNSLKLCPLALAHNTFPSHATYLLYHRENKEVYNMKMILWVCFVTLYLRVPGGEDVKYFDGVMSEVCPMEFVTKVKTENIQSSIIYICNRFCSFFVPYAPIVFLYITSPRLDCVLKLYVSLYFCLVILYIIIVFCLLVALCFLYQFQFCQCIL